MLVEDRGHESTAHLGDTWERFDEWYDFRDNPRDRVHVLLSVDPATVAGSQMVDDHPIAWCHDYDGGRAWYTALGHTDESWTDPTFLQHVMGGIRTAAGIAGYRVFGRRPNRSDLDRSGHIRGNDRGDDYAGAAATCAELATISNVGDHTGHDGNARLRSRPATHRQTTSPMHAGEPWSSSARPLC